ncbi:spore cortex biosynthesis protein YabQ [Clostridium boliviensis]|uniref:Spore cortex biosynthesis protein YabQ n=1 Tax=Clostridium boliviensis TaxID=318465 RepID=A0ABU4GRP8_9CLOT|nr:spore cortex biosynthesis protein YabQ [Clostridium boliviensis]MDW2800306.1 spore cortex biosynthesis protein YabQ [Clostridium boliviensis]
MSVHIVYEVKLLLYSFLTGAGLMMTYDLLRIFRIFIPHSYVFTGIEDMIYWVYAALVTFSLLYEQNDGGLRGYVIAGIFLGMFLYDRLVSRFFLKSLKNLQKYLKMRVDKWIRPKKRQ